jgi:hypothetical protein
MEAQELEMKLQTVNDNSQDLGVSDKPLVPEDKEKVVELFYPTPTDFNSRGVRTILDPN